METKPRNKTEETTENNQTETTGRGKTTETKPRTKSLGHVQRLLGPCLARLHALGRVCWNLWGGFQGSAGRQTDDGQTATVGLAIAGGDDQRRSRAGD